MEAYEHPEDSPAYDSFIEWKDHLDVDLGETWEDLKAWFEAFEAGWLAHESQ